jgi:DNA-binding NarL/FixJ family response regulator
MTTTVLLADDHELFREGMKAVLAREKQIEIVAEASTGGKAVDLCMKLCPDIAIVDIDMPEMNGVLATKAIRKVCGNTRVLILSMIMDEDTVAEALNSGACGYVLKDSAIEELLLAIKAVMEGDTYLSPKVATMVVHRLLIDKEGGKTSALDLLSTREQEVLQLIAEGKSTREIAEHLYLSPKTVENHRANIMRKLDIKDIPSLVKFAIRSKLTSL